MPLSSAAKAALCLCPPAVMAGTVATVPAAKRAVHHLTAPHHAAKPVHRVSTAAARPAGSPAADCPPVTAGPLPAVPLATYAAPIPEEPAGTTGAPAAGGPVQGGIGGLSAGVLAAQPPAAVGPIATPGTTPVATPTTIPVTTPVTTTPVDAGGTTPAVPEPASWLMIIVGVGALGATLRRRRAPARAGRHAAAGAMLWAGSAAEAGDAAATAGAAVHSGATTSALATAAGKAMLCVCPAAVVAGSVVGVPPLRQAVHAATLPAAPAATHGTVPCIQPTVVPVSATAVKGFPDTVTTIARPS